MESIEGMKKLLREMSEMGNKKKSHKDYYPYEGKESKKYKRFEEDEEDEDRDREYVGTNKRFKRDKEDSEYRHKKSGSFMNSEDEDFGVFEDLEDKFIDAMETLESECPEMYHFIKFKIYEMTNGPHFTKDLCKEALECVMDGYKVRELEFKYDEAKQVAKKFGVEFEDFNEYDWCYALNICYHLFKDICKDDIQMCAKLTYLWLCDKAIPEGKAFYHYMKYLKYKHKKDRD
jgi:hypothetical protein